MESIQAVIRARIVSYQAAGRLEEAEVFEIWERKWFLPLIEHLVARKRLGVLSWEEAIQKVADHDTTTGDELLNFYQKCLFYMIPMAEI